MHPVVHRGSKRKTVDIFRRLLRFPLAENVISRLTFGRERSAIPWKLVPPEYLYKKSSCRKATRQGIRYQLDLSNYNDHAIFFGEPNPGLEHLFSLVQPEFHVMDLGANVGYTVLNFAMRCPRGKVYGYEPDSASFGRLQENVRLNDLPHVQVIRKALGDKPGHADLSSLGEHHSGMHRILPPSAAGLRIETVDVTTVDQEVERLGIQKLDLIKIDVEGYEVFVLEGATRTIRHFRPILYIELVEKNLALHGKSAGDMVKLLTGLGYRILDGRTRAALAGLTPDIETDLLCFPIEDNREFR